MSKIEHQKAKYKENPGVKLVHNKYHETPPSKSEVLKKSWNAERISKKEKPRESSNS